MIKIRYVGKKPFSFDNVAHSGKCWQGYGDTHDVTEAQAKMLLKHPDQWELANLEDTPAVEATPLMTVTDEDGDAVAVDIEALAKPLEKMTKAELKAYAKHYFGKDLDARKPTKLLIDQIEELRHDMDVIAGNPRTMKVE